jgi:hypothetical protein
MPFFARESSPRCFEQGYLEDCDACRPTEMIEIFEHQHSSYSKLRGAAEQGCPDCQTLLEGIDAVGTKCCNFMVKRKRYFHVNPLLVHVWSSPVQVHSGGASM